MNLPNFLIILFVPLPLFAASVGQSRHHRQLLRQAHQRLDLSARIDAQVRDILARDEACRARHKESAGIPLRELIYYQDRNDLRDDQPQPHCHHIPRVFFSNGVLAFFLFSSTTVSCPDSATSPPRDYFQMSQRVGPSRKRRKDYGDLGFIAIIIIPPCRPFNRFFKNIWTKNDKSRLTE